MRRAAYVQRWSQFRHLFMGLSAQTRYDEQEALWRDYLARLEQGKEHIVTEAASKTDFAEGTTHYGFQTVPEHEKQRKVRDVFDSVARKY